MFVDDYKMGLCLCRENSRVKRTNGSNGASEPSNPGNLEANTSSLAGDRLAKNCLVSVKSNSLIDKLVLETLAVIKTFVEK